MGSTVHSKSRDSIAVEVRIGLKCALQSRESRAVDVIIGLEYALQIEGV